MGLYWLIDSDISVVNVLKTLQPSTTFYNVTLSRDGSGQGDEKEFLSKIGRKLQENGSWKISPIKHVPKAYLASGFFAWPSISSYVYMRSEVITGPLACFEYCMIFSAFSSFVHAWSE